MNSEEVQQLIQSVIDHVLSMDSITYWIIGFVALISAGLGAFFRGFFKNKARHFVKKEELEEILRQLKESICASEEIRAEITRVESLNQRRWETKRIYYLNLLDALREWGELARVSTAMHDKNQKLIKDFHNPNQDHKELPKQLKQTAGSLTKLIDEAPIFLSDEALVVLKKFSKMVLMAQQAVMNMDIDRADDRMLKSLLEICRVLDEAAGEARLLLQNEATEELGLKASERQRTESSYIRSEESIQ